MTAEDVTREWAASHSRAVKAEHERAEQARDAWIAKLDARLQARRLATNAVAARSATGGRGWRILDAPRESHADLETFAKEAWHRAFHGLPWPAGWRVRWGVLTPTAHGEIVLALTIPAARLIVLSEDGQRHRSKDQQLQSILHELVHTQHPAEQHGPGWQNTYSRVVDFLFKRPASSPPRPAPRTGVDWMTGRPHRGLGDLEYRHTGGQP